MHIYVLYLAKPPTDKGINITLIFISRHICTFNTSKLCFVRKVAMNENPSIICVR